MSKSQTIIETKVFPVESQYRRRPAAEIREIALGLRAGSIFGSWMIHASDQGLLPNIFMPILMMEDIDHKLLQRDEIVHFFGYLNKASPMALNGYPLFMECEKLDKEDWVRLCRAVDKLNAFMDDEDEA